MSFNAFLYLSLFTSLLVLSVLSSVPLAIAAILLISLAVLLSIACVDLSSSINLSIFGLFLQLLIISIALSHSGPLISSLKIYFICSASIYFMLVVLLIVYQHREIVFAEIFNFISLSCAFIFERDFARNASWVDHYIRHRDDPEGSSRSIVYAARYNKYASFFEAWSVIRAVNYA